MKVNEITLFTNRNTLIFDENGNQIPSYQKIFGWSPHPRYDSEKCIDAIKTFINDQPTIYFARWGRTEETTWRHEISIEEFCCLVGFGPDYTDIVNENNEDDL